MKLLLFALAFMGVVTAASTLSFKDVTVEEWNTFKAKYGKTYVMSAGRLFFVLHHSINSWPSVLLHAPRQL